jgi:pyruvate formate lyase activating enzyme
MFVSAVAIFVYTCKQCDSQHNSRLIPSSRDVLRTFRLGVVDLAALTGWSHMISTIQEVEIASERQAVTGTVINIQRFSIHDGPGIRTTVFFKGCSLRCFWCHNPESIRPRPEIQFYVDRCIGCRECLAVCAQGAHVFDDSVRRHNGDEVDIGHEYDRDECIVCGKCVDVCCAEAVELTGQQMTIEAVLAEVLADKAFYVNSGGGVTLSGGEPLLQLTFARRILEGCQDAGVHTAIETAANCPWDYVEDVLPVTDMFMMDLKHMDPVKHKEATGVSNERILANARRLAASGKPVLFRIPVIPTVNDTKEEIEAISAYVHELGLLGTAEANRAKGLPQLELLAFHRLAADKYESLGLDYRAASLEPLSKQRMAELVAAAADRGVEVRSA